MMNKFMTVCAVAMLSATSLFAGEFNHLEFVKLWDAKNYTGAKEYVTANTEYKSAKTDAREVWKRFEFHSATLCVNGPCCDKKYTSIEELFDEITKLVAADTVVAANNKIGITIALLTHVPWRTNRFAFTEAYKNKCNSFLNQEATQKWLADSTNRAILDGTIITFYKRIGAYDNAFKYALLKGDGYRSTILAIDKLTDSAKIIEALNLLADNPLVIKKPEQLEEVVGKFSRLTNPKYDEALKGCMIALNRAFYPNIGKSDAWKAAIVNLQLKMKVYGIATN